MKRALLVLIFPHVLYGAGSKEVPAEIPPVPRPEKAAIEAQVHEVYLEEWGLRFLPTVATAPLWKRIPGESGSPRAALLEMILRRTETGSFENAAAHAKLGIFLYNDRLFLQSAPHLDAGLEQIENIDLRLKRLEVGAFHQGWDRETLTRELSALDSRRLEGRAADLFRLMMGRALWKKLDLTVWGLSETSISALARDGDDLWGGTWNGGIFRFSRSQNSAKVFRSGAFQANPNAVVSILVDPFAVWFAALDGIHRYHKVTEQWRTWPLPEWVQPERVQGVFRVVGNLYLATLGHGLWKLTRNDWVRVDLGSMSENINVLRESVSGKVWMGTRDRGLFLWSPEGGTPVRVDAAGGPTPRNITVIAESNTAVWVGTFGEGLFRYDKNTRVWVRYSKDEGTLSDDWIMSLSLERELLYVGTFGGGIVVVSDKAEPLFLEKYSSPSDVVALVPHRDILYVGTLREGLVLLYLEALSGLP